MQDITSAVQLQHRHEENAFEEFGREPLIPHMLSTEGRPLPWPILITTDQKMYSSFFQRQKKRDFLQGSGGRFYRQEQPVLDKDSTFEDVDACWADVNNDGNID